ncbi:hypothetical protein ACSTS3_04645 [Aquimarina muelleri]|uniref:hypothetical protein n=1 Tax=Aquimarina muelleri TaxID=279356 RepID=UPI003F682FF0
MNTYSIQTILLVIFITFISCSHTAQEEKITHKISTTELPFKFELWFKNYQKRDSSLVYFYIPREISLSNNFRNKVSIQQSYWSKEEGSIVEGKNFYIKDSIFNFTGYPIKLKKGENIDFKMYTRFEKIISYEEVKSLERIFNKNFEEKETYKTSFSPALKTFLNSKIPIKGYTRFSMYNTKTKKKFFYNIPFEF